jgi:ATP-binding cassette subfamily F protein 3
MFGGKASEKKVKVLSGGEKSRLAMIKLLLEPVNLLILDEPTNHLDMRTKDILKQAITEFDGTVIVVSHDRDFLDGMVQKVYEFGDHRVREHLCGIWEFLEKKQLDSLQQMESCRGDIPMSPAKDNAPSAGRLSYEQQKERERRVKQAQKRVKQLEERIQQLEADIAAIEQQLSQGQTDDPTIYDRHASLQQELEDTLTQWEQAASEAC